MLVNPVVSCSVEKAGACRPPPRCKASVECGEGRGVQASSTVQGIGGVYEHIRFKLRQEAEQLPVHREEGVGGHRGKLRVLIKSYYSVIIRRYIFLKQGKRGAK